MHKSDFLFILLITAVLPMSSCGGGSGHASDSADTIAMRYARNITLVDHGGYTTATLRNPWDTTRTLCTYILLPRDAELPAGVEGTVVRVPLEKSVVYTSVHASLIDELGASGAIAGVCDAKYMHNDYVKSALASGKIADCGQSTAPNIEKIIMLKADALLVSAYENSADHNKVAQLGVPVIDCADYMEATPLANAEWMRLYGRLYGKGAEADSMFRATEAEYLAVKEAMAGVERRPVVMSDIIYGGTWGVPGALSTAGVLIEDAGGKNAFSAYKVSGGVQLAPEEVLLKAHDSDVWLIKYSQQSPLTLPELGAQNDIYTRFAPFTSGSVYGCNVSSSDYFDQVQFHPQWVLADLASILHPELGIASGHRYYSRLER